MAKSINVLKQVYQLTRIVGFLQSVDAEISAQIRKPTKY